MTFSYSIENIKSVVATLLFRKEAKIENITLEIVDIKYFKTLWTGLRSELRSIPTFRVQEDAEESTKGLRISSHKGSKTTRNKSHSKRRE